MLIDFKMKSRTTVNKNALLMPASPPFHRIYCLNYILSLYLKKARTLLRREIKSLYRSIVDYHYMLCQ